MDSKTAELTTGASAGDASNNNNASPAQSPGGPRRLRVVIDTDPGVDDVLALATALAPPVSEVLQVEACTIVMGNSCHLDVMARNACAMLQLAGLSQRAVVVKGAETPLLRPYGGHSGMMIHGHNGIGGVEWPFEVDLTPCKHSHTNAAQYLVELVRANPGEITLITLGPLTNIASACLLDASFAANVKGLYMMGGTVDGAGNKAPAAEANIHNDPEAAKIVFQHFSNITMAGLNVTRQAVMSPAFLERTAAASPLGALWCEMATHYRGVLTGMGSTKFVLHDPCAVAAAAYPELFEGRHVRVDVETKGELTAGATVADWWNHWKQPANTHVLERVHCDKLHDLIIACLESYGTRCSELFIKAAPST